MLKKWLLTPGYRFLSSLIMVIGGALLGAVLPPAFFLVFAGGVLILMAGQWSEEAWAEGKEIQCPICGEKTPSYVVKQKNHMYPFLPFVGPFLSIPAGNDYYLVCGKCLQTHVGEQDFSAVKVIAAGGLLHTKQITKEEYNAMRK